MTQLDSGPPAVYEDGLTRFIHKNHLGSSTFLTDNLGVVTQKTTYYPFGQSWVSAGTIKDNRFASLGQRDAETTTWQDPLDPTLFRLYISGLGRWLSPDPLGGSVFNPQSLNRYAYVLNNPASLTDPLGLQGERNCTWANGCRQPHFQDVNPGCRMGTGQSCAHPSLEFLQSYAAYQSWQIAMWVTGGSVTQWGAHGPVTYTVGWSVNSGAYWTGPNGNTLSNEAAQEIGLPGLPSPRTTIFLQANWAALKSGHYWNPLDQAVNFYHKGDWSFREIVGTVCSDHMTVNKTTGEELHHKDTVNPVPLWLFAVNPTAGLANWAVPFTAHAALDMTHLYDGTKACH